MRDRARASDVSVTDDHVVVHLEDGRVLHVPLEWFPRLVQATPEHRNNCRLVGRGVGIHWPDVDEDLSVEGLLIGRSEERTTESLDADDEDNESSSNGSPIGNYHRATEVVR
jgi:hypothetical protein